MNEEVDIASRGKKTKNHLEKMDSLQRILKLGCEMMEEELAKLFSMNRSKGEIPSSWNNGILL